MSDVVEKAENLYSRMLGWEVWNFMSVKYGKVEFDKRNIINFKGYNDSGKSAMLRALDVCFFNIKPQKQTEFIHDDENYFRVVVYFDDGVSILRDKYINGQSLYEMYKGEQLIFTTKNGNTLTKVTEVPKPIQDYLGLISWNKVNINSRSCWEPQLLVETKGSENYQMLNTILKSEEIAVAGKTLNNDKNKLASDIDTITSQLNALKQMSASGASITREMIDYLKEHDTNIDTAENQVHDLIVLIENNDAISKVQIFPQLASINTEQIDSLAELIKISSELSSLPNIPEVSTVDLVRLNELSNLINISSELNKLVDQPYVDLVDISRIDALSTLVSQLSDLKNINEELKNADARQEELNRLLEENQGILNRFGVKTIKCPNCGETIIADDLEAHIAQMG